jgi:hypothetical protein
MNVLGGDWQNAVYKITIKGYSEGKKPLPSSTG